MKLYISKWTFSAQMGPAWEPLHSENVSHISNPGQIELVRQPYIHRSSAKTFEGCCHLDTQVALLAHSNNHHNHIPLSGANSKQLYFTKMQLKLVNPLLRCFMWIASLSLSHFSSTLPWSSFSSPSGQYRLHWGPQRERNPNRKATPKSWIIYQFQKLLIEAVVCNLESRGTKKCSSESREAPVPIVLWWGLSGGEEEICKTQ